MVQVSAGWDPSRAGLMQLPSAVVAGNSSMLIARVTKVRVPLIIAAVAPLVGGLVILGLHSDSWVRASNPAAAKPASSPA